LNSPTAPLAISRDDKDILLLAETSATGYLVSVNGDILSLRPTSHRFGIFVFACLSHAI